MKNYCGTVRCHGHHGRYWSPIFHRPVDQGSVSLGSRQCAGDGPNRQWHWQEMQVAGVKIRCGLSIEWPKPVGIGLLGGFRVYASRFTGRASMLCLHGPVF
jgi:hypothetical protein